MRISGDVVISSLSHMLCSQQQLERLRGSGGNLVSTLTYFFSFFSEVKKKLKTRTKKKRNVPRRRGKVEQPVVGQHA